MSYSSSLSSAIGFFLLYLHQPEIGKSLQEGDSSAAKGSWFGDYQGLPWTQDHAYHTYDHHACDQLQGYSFGGGFGGAFTS